MGMTMPGGRDAKPGEEIAVYATELRCCRCLGRLARLEPTISGWAHYCRECRALSLDEVAARDRLEELTRDRGEVATGKKGGPAPIGVVVQVPMKLDIAWK